MRTLALTSFAVLALCSTAAAQHRLPPPPLPGPLDLQQQLSRLLAEVAAVDGKVQALRGDPNVVADVQRRLAKIQDVLTHLIAVVPATVQPVVVVMEPPPVPPELPPLQPVPEGPLPMPAGDFQKLLASVGGQSFSSGKLSVVGQAATTSFFTVAQVVELLGTFSFADDKLKCVSKLADRIVDPQNLFLLYDAFTFDSDKAKLKRILGGR